MKTGLSPLYDIEMLIKFCVFLEFCVFLLVRFVQKSSPGLKSKTDTEKMDTDTPTKH